MLKQLCNKFSKVNKKYRKFLFGVTLICSLLFGTFEAYAKSMHDIRVIIDGEWNALKNGDITVKKLLEVNNIELHEKDIIDTDLDFLITSDIHIYIDKAKTIVFEIAGEEPIEFISNGGSVCVALKEFQEETGRTFRLDEGQSPAKALANDMVIKITPYTEEIVTITESIPFSTSYVENPNLALGVENVTIAGVDGTKETKIKEIYVNGELESSTVISETVTIEPINKVIEQGTKNNIIQTSAGTFSYSNVMSMNSTAYTAGFESTGKNPGDAGYGITASGMKAQKGVVAVDTSVIPFGTELYIEGYGYAVAGDTGSAIKGHKLDVFFDDYNDAINWGVKTVTVYILE